MCERIGVRVSVVEAQGLFRRFGYDTIMPYQKFAHALLTQPSRALACDGAGDVAEVGRGGGGQVMWLRWGREGRVGDMQVGAGRGWAGDVAEWSREVPISPTPCMG